MINPCVWLREHRSWCPNVKLRCEVPGREAVSAWPSELSKLVELLTKITLDLECQLLGVGAFIYLKAESWALSSPGLFLKGSQFKGILPFKTQSLPK